MEEKYCCLVAFGKRPTELYAETVEELEVTFKQSVDDHFFKIDEDKRVLRRIEEKRRNEKEIKRLAKLQKHMKENKNSNIDVVSSENSDFEYTRDENDNSRSEYINDILQRIKRVRS